MTQNQTIQATVDFVKKTLTDDPSHDWWHTYRVWKIATKIGRIEKANLFIVQMAALLHDIDDWKSNKQKKKGEISLNRTRKWLFKCSVDEGTVTTICEIILTISFKGTALEVYKKSLEAKVIQDADRLDSMGAIGITRAFTYGGKIGRAIYDPTKKKEQTVQDLTKSDSPSSIHHFYDKLLLLKGLMNTKTGKYIATKRHQSLRKFLTEFYSEWGMKNL